MNDKDLKRFLTYADEITQTEFFQQEKSFLAHGRISIYEHCISVARSAFEMNLALHMKCDERKLIRAALLHDYYLYEWHGCTDHLHGYHHPAIAAENAVRDFALTKVEEDAIRSHMWPLNIMEVPSSRIAWLITLADKKCSLHETLFQR